MFLIKAYKLKNFNLYIDLHHSNCEKAYVYYYIKFSSIQNWTVLREANTIHELLIIAIKVGVRLVAG